MCKEALNIYDILWEVHKVIIYSILFHDAVSYCIMICNIAPECLLNTWRGTKTWKTLNMPASKAPAAHKAAQATSREGRLASPELFKKYTKHLTQRNLLTKRTLLLKTLWIASTEYWYPILVPWCTPCKTHFGTAFGSTWWDMRGRCKLPLQYGILWNWRFCWAELNLFCHAQLNLPEK